jgi:hypothetical protein
MAWAKELFPNLLSLRFKTVAGRTALMDGPNVLGVGCDPVEAVASADIRQKKLSAKKAGLTTTQQKEKNMPPTTPPPIDPVDIIKEAEVELPALHAQVGALNQTVSDLNAKLMNADHPAADELAAVNDELIKLNALLGAPLPSTPVDTPIPPVPSVPEATASGASGGSVPNAAPAAPAAETPAPTPTPATAPPPDAPSPGATSDPAALTQALS